MYSTPHGRGIPGSMTLSLTSTLACGTRALLMLLLLPNNNDNTALVSKERPQQQSWVFLSPYLLATFLDLAKLLWLTMRIAILTGRVCCCWYPMNELVTINSRENKVTIDEGAGGRRGGGEVAKRHSYSVVDTVEKFTVKESLSGDAQWYCDCNFKPLWNRSGSSAGT